MSNMHYTVAGVSTKDEVIKLRFATDLKHRAAQLAYHGHSAIKLIELPEGMSKIDAALHLQAHDDFQDEASQATIAQFISKNEPKVPGKRGRPMKLPTLEDVPMRGEDGTFLAREVREQMLAQMVEDAIAKKEAARAKREARAAAKAAAAEDTAAA